ncbi:hypothetical protein CQA88_31640, partial [Klebsiella pneumoniae]
NAKPAILLMIRKLPEANIIQTVDSIRARLPELQSTTRMAPRCGWEMSPPSRIRCRTYATPG